MGEVITDKLMNEVLDQAQNTLCRRLYAEFKERGRLKDCPSYAEAKAIAHILNTMTPFSNSYRQTRFSSQWLMERGRQKF